MIQNSLLLINKPAGISSAKLVAQVKRHFSLKKVGHCGTLDPFATGLMLVCTGKATKISRYLLGSDKKYEATLRLGIATETLDPEGKIIGEKEIPALSEKKILDVFASLTGDQMQRPPLYSALKHEGVPLYKLARKGKIVEKPERPVQIHELSLLGFNEKEIRFFVHCSTGTYVRTLGADIAERLGTLGHLTQLERTETCNFSADCAIQTDELPLPDEVKASAWIVPLSEAISFLPGIYVKNSLTDDIFHGRVLSVSDFPEVFGIYGPIRLLSEEGKLLAIVREHPEKPEKFSYDAVLTTSLEEQEQ